MPGITAVFKHAFSPLRICLLISFLAYSTLAMSVSPYNQEPHSGYVQNGDVRTHFYVSGKGPLMVLLHGFPDNGKTFSRQAAEFSKTHTVVCPTMRGYPPSDVPPVSDVYALTAVVEDILAIFDHFNATKAVVGGHDFGGAAIQLLALLHPERVEGLIIINSPIVPRFHELIQLDKEQQALSAYTIPYFNYKPGDDVDFDYIIRNIRDEKYRQEIRDYLTEGPVDGMFAIYKYNYAGPPYGQVIDTTGMLYQIPTLIIWGLEEEYFSIKMLNKIPENFKNSTRLVTLPGAGHWSFRDQPERVNNEIRSWLHDAGVSRV